MSSLVITEKPSVARAYADALGVKNVKNGYIEGNGYIISWCVGHLVELAQPDAYDGSFKKWSYETLPIMPDRWQYELKKETKTQFKVLKNLMHDNSVTDVICATDAGREGELIFRLVYKMAGCTKPIKRLWLSSMEEKAIREGFRNLRPGKEYDNLYQSALCRQQADWLVGINGTRLFTVLYNKLLKVGRVQTPTLSMIVDREETIRSFKKKPFYTTHIMLNGFEAVSDKFDTENEALNVEACAVFNELKVTKVEEEEKFIAPPRLYDLTTLQRDANRIFGFTSKQTLDYTQSLYEKRLCTYPRTDSQYLSDDMGSTAESVIEAIYKVMLRQSASAKADIGRILNSKKVTDHHAIIPTMEISELNMESLAEGEKKILSLISYRLVAATSGKYIYKNTKVEFDCDGFAFHASGKTIVSDGFRRYEKMLRSRFGLRNDLEDGMETSKELPVLREGQVFRELTPKVVEGFTQPPKSFTEDTLLKFMETAGASEMDDDVERKGLGTPATRADIIEKLVKDGLIKRDKKKLIPTDDGVRIITVLPDIVKSPQMTADWENALVLVSKGEMSAGDFMAGIRKMVTDLINTYSSISEEEKKMFGSENAVGRCPNCGGDVLVGKYGAYCSEKCGMSLGYAMGKKLSEEQIAALLDGEKIFMKGLKSKKGGTYDAYLKPDGVEPYSYTNKDGEEKNGYQFKFSFEFPKKNNKKEND
ncbi:MAG: DNA topoisomerase 3 [Lachnospiraceae bacterium]|nr:DNA topoisomerase 3 [Lachnospiraceae bacterium]